MMIYSISQARQKGLTVCKCLPSHWLLYFWGNKHLNTNTRITFEAWRKLRFIQLCWLLLLPLLPALRQNKPCASLPLLDVLGTFCDACSSCAAPIPCRRSAPAALLGQFCTSHKHACSRSISWFVYYKMTLAMSGYHSIWICPTHYSFICCSKLNMASATLLRLLGSGRGCPIWNAFAISTAFSLTFSSHVSRSSKKASINHCSELPTWAVLTACI